MSYFSYLGLKITFHKDLEAKETHQTTEASTMSRRLNSAIWSNQFLSSEVEVLKYKAMVRTILIYAVEARADTAKTSEAAEMKILNLTLLNRERSDEIRERCDCPKYK